MAERREGGLWCHEVLALLDGYVDGLLDETQQAAVTTHVHACDNCASFGAAYGRVVAALRAEPLPQDDELVLERLEASFPWGDR